MEEKVNEFELHTENWIIELMDAGEILSYEKHPSTFTVFPKMPITYYVHGKRKVSEKVFNLFQEIRYTADFKFIIRKDGVLARSVYFLNSEPGNDKPSNYLFYSTKKTRAGHYIIYVDVKPPPQAIRFSAAVGSSREFPIKQRCLMQFANIYVNKLVPYGMAKCLFSATFTPNSFYYTDKKIKVRAIPKNNKTKQPLYSTVLIDKFISLQK